MKIKVFIPLYEDLLIDTQIKKVYEIKSLNLK